MEGGHLMLVEKEIQHLDLQYMVKICTYNVINKQAQKKASYFYCSRACMLLRPSASQNPRANFTFKTGDFFF